MHILIAGQSRSKCEEHRIILCGLGHTVTVALTREDITAQLERGPAPEVVLLAVPDPEWVRPLREFAGQHIYVIACLASMNGRDVREAWDADVDDIMSHRASPEEIAGRIGAMNRIRKWVGSMGDNFALGDDNPLDALRTLRNLSDVLGPEFAQLIGTDLIAEPMSSVPAMEYAAEIPLSLVSNGVELTLGIGLQKDAVPAFASLLFGDLVGHEMMSDALREFANTAGGAAKRSATAEGETFSLGLPIDAIAFQPPPDARSWQLHAGDLKLCIWISARNDEPQRLSAAMLREGMVTTQPVKNGAGLLLVPAGTVLTQRTVGRLLSLLGPNTLVEVARAA